MLKVQKRLIISPKMNIIFVETEQNDDDGKSKEKQKL